MNLRSQSGTTLIELVITLSITALVMVAIGGVVFGANLITSTWGQRTYLAETTQLLPSVLQADAHRYPPCPGRTAGAELHLCLPGGAEMVTYTAGAGCPCDLVRSDVQMGSSSVIVRGMEAPPAFSTSCSAGGTVDSGSISVALRYHGDAAPEPPVEIFFSAPAGSCGG